MFFTFNAQSKLSDLVIVLDIHSEAAHTYMPTNVYVCHMSSHIREKNCLCTATIAKSTLSRWAVFCYRIWNEIQWYTTKLYECLWKCWCLHREFYLSQYYYMYLHMLFNVPDDLQKMRTSRANWIVSCAIYYNIICI